jgi:hypothetical protein
LSFVKGPVSRAEASRPAAEASALGLQLAHVLR